MIRPLLSLIWIGLVLSGLWGCQSLESRPAADNNRLTESRNQLRLSQLTQWQLQGKIGVTQGNQRDSAAINYWKQAQEHFEIQVSSTLLGLGATAIYGDPSYLTIEESGEPPVSSSNPQQLLAQSLGWQLPLSAMPFWIKGLPSPNAPHSWQHEGNSKNPILQQSDWVIRYDRLLPLSSSKDAPFLPHKVVMSQGNKEIKIVISEWMTQ